MQDNNNSEINLNLKIPQEQVENMFTVKELIITIYNARKIFLTWCCIGLLFGIIAAAGYYFSGTNIQIPETQGDITVEITLNYEGAENKIFPNNTNFNINSFYEISIWENALKSMNIEDITAGDVINQVKINQKSDKMNVYELTISSDNNIFFSNTEKDKFLQELSKEYKNFIINKYYIENNVGKLYNQHLTFIDNYIKDIEVWRQNPFNFEIIFATIRDYYIYLENILNALYDSEPSYISTDGMNFFDYSNQLFNIRSTEVKEWIERLKYNVYIRNIDRYKEEAQNLIDSLDINRRYNLELANSYSELLISFQQKDSQGVIVQDAVNILNAAKSASSDAADLQKQINQIRYNLGALETNEQIIRVNSREAEIAIIELTNDLMKNQKEIRAVVYDYYKQRNGSNAENAVIYSSSVLIAAEEQPAIIGGVSIMRLLMLLIGFTFAGFSIGFCAAFIKKYIPSKK